MTRLAEIPAAGCVLENVLVPAAVLGDYPATPSDAPAGKGLVRTSLGWAGGRFCSLSACEGLPRQDASGWTMLPRLAECHVHLDKTYTIRRTGFSDGTVAGAATLISGQSPDWSAEDFLARMTRAVQQALACGTGMLRTHIDSPGPAGRFPAWQAAQAVRQAFAGRIDIQIAALSAIARVETPEFAQHCRDVAEGGGVLGAFVPPGPVAPQVFDAFLAAADRHGLDVDFHIDENLDFPSSNIVALAEAIGRTGYSGRVMAGHCCSLSVAAPGALDRALDLLAASGLTIVALPTTNSFLQDRTAGRTPRHRAATVVHELRARGVPVALGTDNVEDAFFPFGTYDLLETYRAALPALHLDGDIGGWFAAITDIPARAMGFADRGRIAPGLNAAALLVKAVDWPGILTAAPDARRMIGETT